MTKNQLEYWSLRERQFNNEQVRNETKRSNLAREAETNRSNVARETETFRANQAAERETNRANLARETETNRSNLAKEAETHRANLASEALHIGTLQETIRANQAREAENYRHNVTVEAETHRSNVASESISREGNSIRAQANAIQAEANRQLATHNVVMENIQNKQVETNYRLGVGAQQQAEARLDLDTARHSETVRHNVASENIGQAGTVSGLIGSALNAAGRMVPSILRGSSSDKPIKLIK